ncbi:MAG TPA: toll/interleukin-1 receptor domain-containing protein, partial [Vicinamibacterales bacterium]|nr:toll/interleukin-1 receptor domain-containing protein [Vicinamibacterales bacterium]
MTEKKTPFLATVLAILEWPVRYIFGRDVFISYSRADASRYAPSLVLAVQAKRPKVSFYLDKWIAPASSDLPSSLKRHLRWSSLLVVVCSPKAVESQSVRDEIELFSLLLGRKILPIDVGGAHLGFRAWPDTWRQIGGAAPEFESPDAVERGEPSDEVVERLLKIIDFTIQDRRLTRAVATVAIGALAIMGGAAWYSGRRIDEANAKVKAADDAASTANAAAAKETARATQQQGLTRAAQASFLDATAMQTPFNRTQFFLESLALADTAQAISEMGPTLPLMRRPLVTLQHAAKVYNEWLSPDGRLALTETADDALELWAPTSGRIAHLAREGAPTFSSDSRLLMTVNWDDRATRIRDASTGKVIYRVPGSGVGAAFSPNGRFLATTADDGNVRIWEARAGKPIDVIAGNPQQFTSVRYSKSGDSIVTSSTYGGLLIWNVKTHEPRTELSGEHLVDSADGFIATSQADLKDATIRVIEVDTGKIVARLKLDGPASGSRFSPDGRYLVTLADKSFPMQVLDVASETVIRTIKENVGMRMFSDQGVLAVVTDDRDVELWNPRTDRAVHIRHEDQIEDINFSADGRLLVTAGKDRIARVWDAETGRLLVRVEHQGPLTESALSPDGRILITGGEDNVSRSWETTASSEIAPMEHDAGMDAIALSSDGRMLATAGYDAATYVWDVAAGKPIAKLGQKHEAVAFSPAGPVVVTGGIDSVARLWDVGSQKDFTLWKYRGTVRAVTFSNTGRLVATGSDDHTVHLWRTSDRTMVA